MCYATSSRADGVKTTGSEKTGGRAAYMHVFSTFPATNPKYYKLVKFSFSLPIKLGLNSLKNLKASDEITN